MMSVGEVVAGIVGVLAFEVVLAMGGEESQTLQVLDLEKFGIVVGDSVVGKIGKETIEEIKHIEADARLRTVGLEDKIRIILRVLPRTVARSIDDIG